MKRTFKMKLEGGDYLKTRWQGPSFNTPFLCEDGVTSLYGYHLGKNIEVTVSDKEIKGKGAYFAEHVGGGDYQFDDDITNYLAMDFRRYLEELLGEYNPDFWFYITVDNGQEYM